MVNLYWIHMTKIRGLFREKTATSKLTGCGDSFHPFGSNKMFILVYKADKSPILLVNPQPVW